MIEFGKGPTLKESCPWLRDDATRKRLILNVVERNSVIEGLAPLDDDTRARLLGEPTATRPELRRRPPAQASGSQSRLRK
jgi:hypothetical protein